MYSIWQIKNWNARTMVSQHLIYSFSLPCCEEKKSVPHIIFQLPIKRHLENDLTDLWTNVLFFFSQWRHLDTLWWKISICHYLMVWCSLSERRLLFFDLCLFVFAFLFWLLSLHPGSLLLRSRTIAPPSSEFPQNTLHFSHLFAGVWIAIGTLVN